MNKRCLGTDWKIFSMNQVIKENKENKMGIYRC